MPSVYATWHGQCRDKTKREELCERMADLGEAAYEYASSSGVKFFEQTIEGNILISKAHFMPAGDFAQLDESEGFFSIEKIDLYGVEFQLDPQTFYPSENKVSFVFCASDDPRLDGTIVLVEDKEECLNYVNPIIKEADYYLETANIHLRYFLESWLDDLMGWVKYHYVGNLRYWRYQNRWTDEKILAEHYSKFSKEDYYQILKSNLQSQVEPYEPDEPEEPDEQKELPPPEFIKSVGKLPKELDEY